MVMKMKQVVQVVVHSIVYWDVGLIEVVMPIQTIDQSESQGLLPTEYCFECLN